MDPNHLAPSNHFSLRAAGLAASAVTGLVVTLGVIASGPAHAAAAATPVITCDGLPATIVGTEGDDTITGTDGDDVIWAGPGDDTVRGGKGDDVICGNRGADLLVGGAGDDRILGGEDAQDFGRGGSYLTGDELHGGAGDDYLDIGVDDRDAGDGSGANTVSWSASPAPVTVDLSGSTGTARGEGSDTVVLRPRLLVEGSAYDDTLSGSNGPDLMFGGPGGDTIDGRGGDDTLEGQDVGNDVSQPGDDTIEGGSGDDFVRSFDGSPVLHGGAGDDQVISFSDHPARLYGDDGADSLVGELSRASGYVFDGGAGDDDAFLDRPGSELGYVPAPGSTAPLARLDLTAGTAGVAWQPTASSGTVSGLEHYVLSDYLPWNVTGSAGDDDVSSGYYYRLHASMRMGDDSVIGSRADDIVNGGPGDDTVDGREGHDVCTHTEHRYSCDATGTQRRVGRDPSVTRRP